MDFESARERMVDRLLRQGRIERPSTRAALRAVPRHEFVPDPHRHAAYEDRPLPIPDGQTISAPHMVAKMTDLLVAEPGDRILEIGTGCGYHAAVTSEVVDAPVYSVEYHSDLADEARDRLARLEYDIRIRVGDGHGGWPDHTPYDRAYLTCAPETVPDAVVEQVRPGGVVVAPVGRRRQRLVRIERRADGSVEYTDHGGVRFVRMHGGE